MRATVWLAVCVSHTQIMHSNPAKILYTRQLVLPYTMFGSYQMPDSGFYSNSGVTRPEVLTIVASV